MNEIEGKSLFRRELGLLDTTFLVIGSVVGSGIFLTPGLIAAELPSSSLLLFVWVLGGAITLCGALSFGELGAMYPEAGGQYVYLREAYGPASAFLFGWGFFGFIMCGGLAALAVAFAEFLGSFIPLLSTGRIVLEGVLLGIPFTLSSGQFVAAAAILLLTWLHSRGLKTGVFVQNALTFFRIAAVLALVILGIFAGRKAGMSNFRDFFPGVAGLGTLLRPIGLALIAVFWTYDGWYSVNCTAGEIRNPGKNIPRGLLLGTAAVMALYLLTNLVYLMALPIKEIAGVVMIGETAAAALFGSRASAFFSLVVMVSVFGCLNATVLYGPRVYYAMAEDGSFFRGMGRLHPRFRVPTRALWGQAAWAAVLCLTGTYQSLYEFLVFALLVFFAATGAAVFVLRRRQPDRARPYRTWGYPFVPGLFVLSSTAIFLNVVLAEPVKSLIGAALLGAGFPAYLFWRHRRGENLKELTGTPRDGLK